MEILYLIIASLWLVAMVGWIISLCIRSWRQKGYYLYWCLALSVFALILNLISAIS